MKFFKPLSSFVLAGFFLCALATCLQASPKPGDAAPDFTLKDSDGKTQTLSSYKGKYVVLEWFNEGCPFVKKHYESGSMQALQKEETGKGVVWLSVISSAEGKQGFSTPEQANAARKKWNIASTATLLDAKGEAGKLYEAKTTPHMFVIDPEGKVVYMGAIDDKPTSDPADVKTAKNYVKAALDEAMAGKPVATVSTTPYGCSVKY
ncbi:MAG TPA: thioredoxin family protein [bacterium]|nr:thioredoxin family protein [bacterium]